METIKLTDVPSLEGFDSTGGGAWPNGWYPATIVPSFTTNKGNTFETEDFLSKAGDSRNIRVLIEATDGENTRTLFHNCNYRLADLTPERIAEIRELRKVYAKEKKWPDTDAQRTNLNLEGLRELEKVMGRTFSRNGSGLDVTPLHNLKVDVYLGTDEKGFNEVRQVAASGTRVRT